MGWGDWSSPSASWHLGHRWRLSEDLGRRRAAEPPEHTRRECGPARALTVSVRLPLPEMNASAPQSPSRERVALVHDYLLVMRGAERTFAAMADLYPQAPIFTLLYDENRMRERFAEHSVTTSPLQRLGVRQTNFRRLLPLYPLAIERLKLPPTDVVLSSSSAFAHGVRVPSGAVHVCYCHAPFRYAWYEQARALGEVPAPLRPLLRLQLARMRRWDLSASRRVDSYIANSQLTRERIKRFYGRDATVIHPPVETHRFAPGMAGDSLLVVSELVRAQARAHRARGGAPGRCADPRRRLRARSRRPQRGLSRGRVPRAGKRQGSRRAVRERPSGARGGHRGVWHHRRRGAGGRTAGHRRRRGRGARDGAGRPHRMAGETGRCRFLREGDRGHRRARLRPRSCRTECRALLGGRVRAQTVRACCAGRRTSR